LLAPRTSDALVPGTPALAGPDGVGAFAGALVPYILDVRHAPQSHQIRHHPHVWITSQHRLQPSAVSRRRHSACVSRHNDNSVGGRRYNYLIRGSARQVSGFFSVASQSRPVVKAQALYHTYVLIIRRYDSTSGHVATSYTHCQVLADVWSGWMCYQGSRTAEQTDNEVEEGGGWYLTC
jgi:hypothetical protein